MSIIRLFRLGIRAAAWATPHVKEWNRKSNLNVQEGTRHLEARNWSEAEKYLTLALLEKRASSGKPRVDLLLGLGKAQRKQAKLAAAEGTAREAIEVSAKSWSDGRGAAMESLAELQIEQSKFAEAGKTIAEVEKMEMAKSRPDHAMLARCSRKMGGALMASGRTQEALQAFERATQLSEQVFGPDHPETANALAELASVQHAHGKSEDAHKSARRALEIHRAKLGPDSQEAAHDLHVLAGCLADSGDLAGAMGEYERVLALKERQIGGDRQKLAETQVRLAVLYYHAGRVSPARELLIHAVGTLERKGGEVYAIGLETLAEAEEQANRPQEARRLRQKLEKLKMAMAAANGELTPVSAEATQELPIPAEATQELPMQGESTQEMPVAAANARDAAPARIA